MGETAYGEFRKAYRSAHRNYQLADGSLLLEDQQGALEFKAYMREDIERLREAWARILLDDDDPMLDWLQITGLQAHLERMLSEKGL